MSGNNRYILSREEAAIVEEFYSGIIISGAPTLKKILTDYQIIVVTETMVETIRKAAWSMVDPGLDDLCIDFSQMMKNNEVYNHVNINSSLK